MSDECLCLKRSAYSETIVILKVLLKYLCVVWNARTVYEDLQPSLPRPESSFLLHLLSPCFEGRRERIRKVTSPG